MLYRIKYIVFLLCFSTVLSAQSISGKVESITGEIIPQAQIILKDSADALQIKEFTLAMDGIYQLEIKKKYTSVWIEASCLGYKKSTHLIEVLLAQDYIIHFALEPAIMQLDEIIVADTRRFEQRGDTLSFNVDAYRDGSERNIEDLIKKLPGIEVNENTGTIKYKGKVIETVNLDGDNLFDANYAVGTRNIDVNMVEEVEAIENYNENPLLHGLDGNEDVALNLVLKKTKTKYSGNIQPSLGLFLTKETNLAIDFSSTLLGVAHRYKSFATLSYNNVGSNQTPYNYTEYSEEIDVLQNPLMFAKKYISDSFF
ncbi:MAG: carboxypeptidase-like regulatory domain-containing protein [Saprospiraceae bacterium]|nr:carboxypeptidase-like regulatory domain-containing protein [Saprospiraceae bacterium]